MEFKDYFIMALVFGLFIICVFTFSSYMSVENSATVNINQEPLISRMVGNVSKQLNESQATAQSQQEAFNEETKSPISTSLGFVFSSILSALTIFRDIGVGIFIAFFGMITEMFHGNPILLIVSGTVMAIMIGSIVLAIWSVIRTGR